MSASNIAEAQLETVRGYSDRGGAMPYVSDKQRRYMHWARPRIAAEWDEKYGGKIEKKEKKPSKYDRSEDRKEK